ncbi:unnamed protein product [Rotaria sp. Silwood2]|nr:unnamed protein product [Rotaria sp. Silwood2]CAF2954690.1 unnamed protein product [Rotaria sp. Silwood2]CAF4251313.1 unnamed protein product [Rotaria sp. Silwood2]
MVYIYLFFSSLFLYNINLVSSTVYSCNRNAECGCSKVDVAIDKIVGGESAVDLSWGWAISLQRSGSHFCGGSIISPLHIITAAHCVPNSATIISDAKVVASIDILSQSTSSTAQVRSITNVFSHPNYNSFSNANDIAILRLDQPLDISYEKGTARLCIPSFVSADNNTCQGDSGGPLMRFEPNKRQWVLAGLTSYGRGCGEPDYAGVYTRASAYRDWLRSVVNDNFIELVIDETITTTTTTTTTKPQIHYNCTDLPSNGASSVLINSLQSILSPYWSFILSLYTFVRR